MSNHLDAQVNETIVMETRKQEAAKALEGYNKKNAEYKEIIKEREAELLKINKAITAGKKELDEIVEKTTDLNRKLAIETAKEKDKLKDLDKEIKQKEADMLKKQDDIILASKANEDYKVKLDRRASKIAIDELKISKAKHAIKELEDKEEAFKIKEADYVKKLAKLNERDGVLKGAEEKIASRLSAAQKQIDIYKAKEKNVQAEINKARAETDKYVNECRILGKREKAVVAAENEVALKLMKANKLLSENEVTKSSLAETKARLEMLDVQMMREIKTRKLEKAIKNG